MTWKGIAQSVLDEAGFVWDGDVLRIPYRKRNGEVFRWRSWQDGRAWWEAGERICPFGLETLKLGRYMAVVICEGESDTLAVREGHPELLAVGLPGAGSWQTPWAIIFEHLPQVYVMGDGDKAGRRMMDKVMKDLPNAWPVILPEGMDARALLQSEGPGALDPYLAEADRSRGFYEAVMASEGRSHGTRTETTAGVTHPARGIGAAARV